MARSLDAIIAELEPGYAGSRTTTQNQINALPGETDAQLGGLKATAEQSHEEILNSARRRGVGFGGIPIGEQVKYDATTFKPAVANLYSAQNARKTSLEEALNGLYRDQRTQAVGVRETELGRDLQQQQLDENRRQFEANLVFQREQLAQQAREAAASRAASAASSAGIGSYFGGGAAQAQQQAQAQAPQITDADRQIFTRAQSLSKLLGQSSFNSIAQRLAQGNDADKEVVRRAYQIIGHADAPALKKLGLI